MLRLFFDFVYVWAVTLCGINDVFCVCVRIHVAPNKNIIISYVAYVGEWGGV